jgi:hypothetical protein
MFLALFTTKHRHIEEEDIHINMAKGWEKMGLR